MASRTEEGVLVGPKIWNCVPDPLHELGGSGRSRGIQRGGNRGWQVQIEAGWEV